MRYLSIPKSSVTATKYTSSRRVWGRKSCEASLCVTMTQCFTMASNNFELPLEVTFFCMITMASKQLLEHLLELPVSLILASRARILKPCYVSSNRIQVLTHHKIACGSMNNTVYKYLYKCTARLLNSVKVSS